MLLLRTFEVATYEGVISNNGILVGISETQGHIAILDHMRRLFLRDSRLAGSPMLQVAEVSGLV